MVVRLTSERVTRILFIRLQAFECDQAIAMFTDIFSTNFLLSQLQGSQKPVLISGVKGTSGCLPALCPQFRYATLQ